MKGKQLILSILVPVLGLVAGFTRLTLYRVGLESTGLLAVRHPLELLLWALTAATALVILLTLQKFPADSDYEAFFRPSILGALGCWAMAAGLILSGDAPGSVPIGALNLIYPALRWVNAVAMVAAGIYRLKGKQPHFVFHSICCLFLALRLIMCYQDWSRDPQIQDYVFSLLGSVALALFAYQQAAFDVGLGRRRTQHAIGALGVFLCCVAASGESPLFFLTGSVWMLTNLASGEESIQKRL